MLVFFPADTFMEEQETSSCRSFPISCHVKAFFAVICRKLRIIKPHKNFGKEKDPRYKAWIFFFRYAYSF